MFEIQAPAVPSVSASSEQASGGAQVRATPPGPQALAALLGHARSPSRSPSRPWYPAGPQPPAVKPAGQPPVNGPLSPALGAKRRAFPETLGAPERAAFSKAALVSLYGQLYREV